MPNKHLEHLEDLVFSGRKEVLDAVWSALNKPKLSVKWDGAPAIVFGTNPANGQFFVGTKSVSIKSKSRSVILRRILTNITRATLRTFFAYAFIIFLVSVELSKLTSSVSAEVLFIALTLWSIVSPVDPSRYYPCSTYFLYRSFSDCCGAWRR